MAEVTVKKLNIIVTGSTGMVGEGVLHESLLDDTIERVLIINRKPLGITHPKLKEIIQPDMYDLSNIKDQLHGYDACFFCLGISSIGMKEPEYFSITYTLTMNIAQTLCRLNPSMVFNYVSGAGTDSTENGRSMWARVKGKTENDLMKLPFKKVYAFRPGYIHPTKGLTKAHSFYKYIGWMYRIGRALFPDGFNTLKEVGQAMIHIAQRGYDKQIITPKDIAVLAKTEG
jgi:uncharacterized protein YbjT (DUF2867 family)